MMGNIFYRKNLVTFFACVWIGFSPVVLKFYDSYTQYLFPLEIRYLISPQVQARPTAEDEAISSSNKLHLGFSRGTVF